jgi:hypothetical protein
MKSITPWKSVFALFACLWAGPLWSATTFVSTFDLHVRSAEATRVVLTWSTNVSTGLVGPTNLIGLSFQLFDGANAKYQDNAIIASAVQPIAGATRTLSDIKFQYDFSSGKVNFFDNNYDVIGNGGVFYNLFTFGDSQPPTQTAIYVVLYTRSAEVSTDDHEGFVTDGYSNFSQNTAAIPEPGTYAALLGGGGLLFAASRRRRQDRTGHLNPSATEPNTFM